jgi:HK97 family phage major capsid protein
MKIAYLGAALAVLVAVCLFGAFAPEPAALAAAYSSPLTMAMGVPIIMNQQRVLPTLNARARGIFGVRADAGNGEAILNELKRTFEAFKAERKAELDGVNGRLDVLQTEKVDRINADITKLQGSIDEVNALIAALRVGGGGDEKGLTADQKAHAKGFENYFRRGADAGLRDLEVKASASTDNDPNGGYTVDKQTEQTIDRVLSTVSAIRSIANVMTISAGTYRKLVNQGGATGGWVGEKASRPETNTPTLAALEFPAMELYANPAATQTLLDDSRVDIAAWLGDEVSITFAEKEGLAFYSGDGVNQPRGIASYTMIANASYAWGSVGFVTSGIAAALHDSTHSGAGAILDLVYSIKQGYRQNSRFLMNRATQGVIRKFTSLGDEKNLIWQPSLQLGQPATLAGYPISDDDNVADIGANAFPVWFGDFKRAYLIVDRAGIRVLRDPFTAKPYVLFYTTKRVGGGIQNFEAIKALKCST